jgi:SAM-dependent methyltransferase
VAPACAIEGIDIDPAALEKVKAEDPAGTYRLVDLDRTRLPAPAPLDVVIALDVLEHLEEDERVVREVAGALRPGGLFAVNVPAHPWLFSNHDLQLGHVRRYRPREIQELLARNGFELVHATPLFTTSLLLIVLWRLVLQPLLRLRREDSDVSMRLPRPVDAALYRIARAEGAAARLRLPFGTSHFVLARKRAG